MNISSKKYFADWITTIIKPCCIVYSSQKAKDIISKNNLTPSEYLRPFGDFKEFTITSPFNKKLIKSFILDFIDSEEFNSIPKDKYNTYIKALLKHNDFYPHWNANQLKHSDWKIEEMINNTKYIGFPWCNAFERMLFELLKCQKTEMYQQPIANVYMCSIDEDVSVINELKHRDNVPLLLKDNKYYFQPEINLLIVLIDKSSSSNSNNTVDIDIEKQKTLYKNQYKDTHYITFPEINKGNKVNNNEFWKNYISYINLCGLKNRSNSTNSNSNNNSHSNSNSNSHSNSIKQSNIPSSFKPESPTLQVITSITSFSPKLTLYDDDEDEEQITYGKYITNEEIAINKHIIYDFFEFYTLTKLKHVIECSTKAINERKKSKGFLSLFKHKEKRVKYDNNNIYLLSTREKHLYYLSFLNIFFRNYAQACELLRELIEKIKPKSLLHYHFLFELHTISTVLSGEKIMLKEHLFLEILKNHLEDNNYAYALRFLVLFIKQYETKANFSDNKATNLFVKKYKSHLLNNKIHHTHSEAFLFLVYRAMIWEKQALFSLISSYNQNPNYICKRNFAFRMFQSGKFYKDIPFENNPFLLHSYGNAIAILNSKSSLIFEKDINMLSSFSSIKQEIYQILAKVCDDMKLSEESFIFSKLSLELSAYMSMQYISIKGKHKLHNQPNQPFIMNYYMKNLKDIKQNDCKLISFINYKDLLELNIVDIDNTSLYVVEHQDEEIAKRFLLSSIDDLQNYKMKNGNNNHHQRIMNWSNYFSKYAITDSKQRYVHLDRRDVNVIKYLDNVTSNKDPSFNSFHKKTFTANVGERLHILFTIFNPLNMDLPISSIKLIYFCTKFSNTNTNNINDDSSSNININSSDNLYVQSTEKKVNLKGGTKQQIRLSITSEHPCVISITGVEIVIYKDIRIQHLFSKRRVSMLYNKKPNDNCLRSTSFSDLQRDSITRYSIDREREMNLIRRRTNSIRSFKHVLQINTNKEISYEILQFNNNINITCPLGDCVECYRYQCLLYPIEIENNTSLFKIKQFSVFVYNSNHTKGKVLLTLKTFYTFNIRLNQGNKKEVVYIPIYSTEKGAIDVKVVVKFKDESKKKYIEIKRFSFRVLVKPSFEVDGDYKVKMIKREENEQYNNVYVDYWINLTMHNSNMLTDLDVKDIYTGCNVSLINEKGNVSKWWSNNVIKGKYYKCLTLSITDNDNNEITDRESKLNKQDDEIDPDDPHLNEHLIKKDNTGNVDSVMNVYRELLKCYQEKKNTIIFTWISNQTQQTPSNTSTQQQQQQITGFFILDLPELLPIHTTTPTQLSKPSLTLELTQPFLQTLIENICTISLTLKPFPSNNTTLIILTLTINCDALFPFNNIISFKTFILPNNNTNNLPLTWLGTTKYTHLLSTHHPNYTVNFICQTSLKGTIPLNHIGILFTFSTSTHPALSTTTFKPKYTETHI